MSGRQVAVRVAWREARRAKGRSGLVVAMILLPVAALAFGSVTAETFTLSPAERADRLMGAADAVLSWPIDGPVRQAPAEFYFLPVDPNAVPRSDVTLSTLESVLPQGSRTLPDRSGHLTVNAAAGTVTLTARALDYSDPLAHGILRQLTGRAPEQAALEVVLTPPAATRLGVNVGGSVSIADTGRALQVVGLVEDPGHLDVAGIVLPTGALTPQEFPPDPRELHWLVKTPGPVDWTVVKRLNESGVVAISRHVLAHPPSDAERYQAMIPADAGLAGPATAVLVSGMAILEIILLAGPAFAVGARRRQHALGLVFASGGTGKDVRRIVLADGLVLGAVAAGAGIATGLALAAICRPLVEEHVALARSGAFRVSLVALAILAGLAILTGTLAALAPAVRSSRQEVVAALAGRRGIVRSQRRWPILGLALAVAGAVVAFLGSRSHDLSDPKASPAGAVVILGGLVLMELGLVLCTSATVGLMARTGRWLPLTLRMALRDMSRNRTAAAPAVSAVMAAVVASLATGVVLVATEQREAAAYRSFNRIGDVAIYPVGGRPGARPAVPAAAVVALRHTFPVLAVHEVGVPRCAATDCDVAVQTAAARDCPYSYGALQRRATSAEQQAARRDPRCDGYGVTYQYFGNFNASGALAVVVEPEAAGSVAGLGSSESVDAAAALRAGKIVVDDPRVLDGDRITMLITAINVDGRPGDVRQATAPGHALPQRTRAPVVMMTRQTAESFGLQTAPLVVLATTGRVPTEAEQDRLQASIGRDFQVFVERGPQSHPGALLLLAIIAGVIALGASAIATGLCAVDRATDHVILAAVGASPRVRKVLALGQSGAIAGLGSLLGTAAGLGAAAAVLFALNQSYATTWPGPEPYPIAVPWLNVGIALVVVPLVAMLGATLFTRSRLPIESRRPH